jgi:thiamine kinase-like enzyme
VVTNPFGDFADANMPWLDRAMGPLEVERCLQSPSLPFCENGGRVSLKAIRVTRYKPGRRCLFEYDLSIQPLSGPRQRMTVIGKVRAKGCDEATCSLHRALWDAGFDKDCADQISVPKALGVIPDFRMWLQTKVLGVAVTELLAKPDGVRLARRVADAARKLHQAGVPAQRQHTMEDELRILEDRLQRVGQMQPQWTERLQRLVKACGRLGASVPKGSRSGIHRDFYPAQIVVDGTRLWLLDFDLYCQGDPGLDIGNFTGHLTEQSLRCCGNALALSDCEQALEERFVELSEEAVRPAIRAYALLTLARHIYVSTQFEERRSTTLALVELCEERLNQLKML